MYPPTKKFNQINKNKQNPVHFLKFPLCENFISGIMSLNLFIYLSCTQYYFYT